MIGRFGDPRAASSYPAARNAATVPVHANASGIFTEYGSTGYPSMMCAP
jgi:hypothetical protein